MLSLQYEFKKRNKTTSRQLSLQYLYLELNASKMQVKKKGNVNVAQETMMPSVLVGTTADVNEEFESHDNTLSFSD